VIESLYAQGRLVEAAQAVAEAIAKGETSELWNDWGVIYIGLAQKAFRRALEMDPWNGEAMLNLGVSLFCQGKLTAAAPLLRHALAESAGPERAHIAALLALCEPPARETLRTAPDFAAVEKEVRRVLDGYFERGDRSPDVVTPAGHVPQQDSKPEWTVHALNEPTVHDEDYLVFRAFQDPESVILDIGGNSGYSAVSMWASGTAAKVFTFEPNAGLADCLKQVAELRPGRYDYALVALGDSDGTLDFAVPVMNGLALGALATACAKPEIDWLSRLITDYFKKYLTGAPFESFRMHRFHAPVTRLDDFLVTRRSNLREEEIVAVKVDAEGYEGQVLAGARRFLTAQRPLILAEGGHTNPLVFEALLELGYSYGVREGRQLRATSGPGTSINGFFIHPERFEDYRRIRLLI